MNKKSKPATDAKLRLSRETVATLQPKHLIDVVGGVSERCVANTKYAMSCGGGCNE
jgi:hypothetical protein